MSMGIDFNSTNRAIQKYSSMLSSGSKFGSAANDAAGLAIAEKITTQINGYEQGIRNTADMQNLIKTAEGAMSTISDSLQRIRELSIQASNTGIYNDDDRKIIQNEISQLLEHVDTVARDTQFNRINLLDGSFTNKNTASYPDGGGAQISIGDVSLVGLQLENYDVTGDFDITQIDAALDAVNSMRSELGAMSNRFDHTTNATSLASLNLAAARSRIADTDMAKASMELNKNKVLLQYQIAAQKRQMDDEKKKIMLL